MTPCRIGIVHPNGTVDAILCANGRGVGRVLASEFTDVSRVCILVGCGDRKFLKAARPVADGWAGAANPRSYESVQFVPDDVTTYLLIRGAWYCVRRVKGGRE